MEELSLRIIMQTIEQISGTWIHWIPFEEVDDAFVITSYTHNFDGLFIELAGIENNKKLTVFFEGSDVICMVLNETYRMRLIDFREKNPDPSNIKSPLFMVEGNGYMKYLSEESFGLIDALDFRHYYIEDSEWSFDVVCKYRPRIELFIDDVLVNKLDTKSHTKIIQEEAL